MLDINEIINKIRHLASDSVFIRVGDTNKNALYKLDSVEFHNQYLYDQAAEGSGFSFRIFLIFSNINNKLTHGESIPYFLSEKRLNLLSPDKITKILWLAIQSKYKPLERTKALEALFFNKN